MIFPPLQTILVTDRIRRRTTVHGHFSEPVLHEQLADSDVEPFFVTTTKGPFILGKLRPGNIAWTGFTECPLEEEGTLMRSVHQYLVHLSNTRKWPTVSSSIEEGLDLMETRGHAPAYITMGLEDIRANGWADTIGRCDELMVLNGGIAKIREARVLVSEGLEKGQAILTTKPSMTGFYVRSYDHLALLITRVDRSTIIAVS